MRLINLLLQILLHLLPCEVVGGLQGADGSVQRFRHLLVRELVVIAEGKNNALLFRKFDDGLLQPLFQTVGREVVILRRHVPKVVGEFVVTEGKGFLLLLQKREAGGDDNAGHPRFEAGITAEAAEEPPDLDEYVLREVVGVLVRIDEPADIAIYVAAVFVHQHTEASFLRLFVVEKGKDLFVRRGGAGFKRFVHKGKLFAGHHLKGGLHDVRGVETEFGHQFGRLAAFAEVVVHSYHLDGSGQLAT